MFAFTVQDLFIAGLALDLIGAALLAKALFKSPRAIANRSSEFDSFDPHVAVQLAEDKVDGMFGLTYLSLGFGLQAVGYEIILSTSGAGNERGTDFALTALAIGLLMALPTIGMWKLLRSRFVRRLLLAVARVTSVDPLATLDGRPSRQVLVDIAAALGETRAATESEADFSGRVFGARDTRDERSAAPSG